MILFSWEKTKKESQLWHQAYEENKRLKHNAFPLKRWIENSDLSIRNLCEICYLKYVALRPLKITCLLVRSEPADLVTHAGKILQLCTQFSGTRPIGECNACKQACVTFSCEKDAFCRCDDRTNSENKTGFWILDLKNLWCQEDSSYKVAPAHKKKWKENVWKNGFNCIKINFKLKRPSLGSVKSIEWKILQLKAKREKWETDWRKLWGFVKSVWVLGWEGGGEGLTGR